MKKRANTYVTILKAVYSMVKQCQCNHCGAEHILYDEFDKDGNSISVAETLLSILVSKHKLPDDEYEAILCGELTRKELLKICKRMEN